MYKLIIILIIIATADQVKQFIRKAYYPKLSTSVLDRGVLFIL